MENEGGLVSQPGTAYPSHPPGYVGSGTNYPEWTEDRRGYIYFACADLLEDYTHEPFEAKLRVLYDLLHSSGRG